MELATILNDESVNIEHLQKGLKHIGLNLSKFDCINEDQIPDLLELFKIAVDIDSKTTNKFIKMDIRSKLDKILKGQPVNTHNNSVAIKEITEKKFVETEKIKNTRQNLNFTSQPPLPHVQKKLGKVLVFDYIKGFGFVYCYDDKKECYVNVSKLVTSGINKDDIVIFETINNSKKSGELEAINVSNKIPTFVFNKESKSKSFAYPLLQNHLEKEIALTEKYETGFAIIKAYYTSSNWRVSVLPSEIIQKSEYFNFCKNIIVKFLSHLNEYLSTFDLSTLEWLTESFQTELKESDIYSISIDVINIFEQKSITAINKEIKNFKNISFLQPLFEEKKKTLNKISFALWNQGDLEKLPIPSNQAEVDSWLFEILPFLDWQTLQRVLAKLLSEQGATKQVEESYKYLIMKGWQINTKEELETVATFLESFKSVFPFVALEEANYTTKYNEFYIELHDKGLIQELSDDRIRQYIEELKSIEEKVAFIEKQPSNKILPYYFSFPALSKYQERYVSNILESEFSKIDFLCFDLESNGERINEFAWKNRLGIKSEADFENKEEGISELLILLNSGALVIGQNIKEFDSPILAKHCTWPSSDFIWDTLEIEMLLNPERFSYGLKTQHNAKSDTELTYRLFKNQLSRILGSKSNPSAFKELLPLKAIEAINQIGCNPICEFLDYEYFVKQSNEFYRSNPTNRNISEETFTKLTNKITEEGHKVIIAPEFLWNTLSHQFDFRFYSDSKSLGFCLNKEKIELTLGEEKLLKAILMRFVDSYTSKGLQPYFQHLPIAIQLKLSAEQVTLICDNIELDFRDINDKPICIKPTDIEILKQYENQITDLSIIVVGNELYNLISKLQLGQDFDFATIFDRLKNEHIWLQMSGGKSFISVERSHCKLLGITEFPEFVQNIWLEKIGNGKFKIWCNLNFEVCINTLRLKEVCYIDWVDEKITKTNSFIIRPDARKSGYIAEQKRVNPESLYRKIYWVYQFKLFEGIGNSDNPKILIVNDELESEKLSAYARRKGYYIPDTKASLARQVELLHTHGSANKLLIATFQTLDKVISSNYTGPLDFIWDSFLLQEKLQMLKGKISDGSQISEEQNEDDYQTDINSVQKDYDLFSLIKLHKPLIDYYYKMLFDNNPDSQLFLCDTRLTDYYGIEKSLNLNAKSVQMWYKEAAYVKDIEFAAEFFSSVHENADTDFNIDEAKEILQRIFLIPEDGGDPHPWYDYQHPCLNEILPAKKDLLVSLPTGAGKSLLFQGPALFRSAFSCKLSIVISPLRALMQDQVDALWDRGFYSNVEFLSGDKSHVEIRDIYRRISGGEITLLYITPERFRSRSFENCLLTRLDADSGLEYVVFDEAHCISQWGQEFRPDYLNAGRKIADYSKNFLMKKLLFSATISEQVFEEISLLMPGVKAIEGTEKSYNPVRDHIKMDFKHNVDEVKRLIDIANYLKSGSFNPKLSRAIIFVKSRRKVEECALIMADSLKEIFGADCEFSDKVGGFHAGMDAEDRKDTYENYKTGEIVILFATKAFGMGMDIPNIHFVAHYSPPSTFEDFLQEVGRGGRNEKQRLEAGFNNTENPIKTFCLTANNDFAKLKDQLHESRISWHEVKDIKLVLEEYMSRFKPLIPNTEIPIAVPFNLYSNEKGSAKDDDDNKFRIALHWLEQLERIKLGYFTITHLEFDSKSLNNLAERINKCPDKDCEKICYAIIELTPNDAESNKVVQLSIASLRSISKLSLENLFTALLKNHTAGILKLLQDVVIEPTKIRLDETNHCKNTYSRNEKYPALRAIFSLASKILGSVSSNSSKFFEGEELDDFLKETIRENINFKKLPWTKKDKTEDQTKEYNDYIKDIFKKRSKHAFTIIRKLGKTKHETKMEKVIDSNRKIRIKQSVFNGYHKKEEWLDKIAQLEIDCIKLLDYVAKQYFDKNIKKFNWPDIISELNLKKDFQYLSDLFFILSVLGYSKSNNEGLLPTGIEVYLTSINNIDETDLHSLDKKIFEEFEQTRKVRELKLISLEVLAGFHKGSIESDAGAVRKKQDTFIRKYFGCNSLESLLQLLQDELPPNDPLLVKWRGDAIKEKEDQLNYEQRKVYDAEINQHINVMAGPGSGKTHTLTLRVARLVHHIGTNPEEILVLAYNRAVVSELKERLGNLFSKLGYGNLAKRIKIFTFHGLAKRYCQNDLEGKPFEEWEKIFLNTLTSKPGQIMSQLGSLKHILVDEFQDINEVRIETLNTLVNKTNAFVFIIGDPNQSIYGYDRKIMSPYHYYDDFDKRFNPNKFSLVLNHRSYPEILNLASRILTLPAEYQHLIPKPTRVPDENFSVNYAEIIDRTQQKIDWWDRISILMKEKVGLKPYKQIAILFRTNNEVYRGFQKVKGLNLPNIRIRIQGSSPCEFTRIRECHAVILFLKSKTGQQIPSDFTKTFHVFINDLITQNPNWNHFYIRVVHALILEYLDEQDENRVFDNLLEFIIELTHKDDGQLYKIYDKYLDKVSINTHETEIVLTTMHKVKGLEFDCVIIPPSFSNLPFIINGFSTQAELQEQLDEEKRLAFVAYSRARYRLLIFKHSREIALVNNEKYEIPETEKKRMGISIQPEIKKLNIGWAAKAFNFKNVNSYINTLVKSGDFVFVRERTVPYNGTHFIVHELLKENTNKPIGELARKSDINKDIKDHQSVSGFVVNEVVVWSYEDTRKFDLENATDFAKDWCQEAKSQGYIYLVDFAGFGTPID